MVDYKTLRVPEDAYDAAKGVRQVRAELATEGLVFPGPGDDDAPDVVTGE